MAASSAAALKVCLLGEGRVGKTSILLKFVKDEFSDQQVSSIDASYMEKVVPVDGVDHKLSIWDTAGQERFHALTPLYYRDANGALLVYDITDSHSFQRVRDWVKELRKVVGPGIAIALAGNKCDLESKRHVPADEALAYAEEVGALHVLTSAKTGKGLLEAFQALTAKMAASAGGGGGMGGGRGRRGRRPKLTLVDEDEGAREKGGAGCCGGS